MKTNITPQWHMQLPQLQGVQGYSSENCEKIRAFRFLGKLEYLY